MDFLTAVVTGLQRPLDFTPQLLPLCPHCGRLALLADFLATSFAALLLNLQSTAGRFSCPLLTC